MTTPEVSERATVRRLVYDMNSVRDELLEAGDLESIVRPTTDSLDRREVLWIDVVGVTDSPALATIAERLGLHTLAMEDAVHEGQRPKVDVFDDHLFVAINLPPASDDDTPCQVSLFLGAGFVLTIRSARPNALAPAMKRVHRSGGRVRRNGSDMLAYAILDGIVDSYAPRVEALQERVEDIGDDLLASRGDEPVTSLFDVRRQLVTLRRDVVWMREVFLLLQRDDGEFMAEATMPFLRDCADHVAVNLEAIESGRDLVDTLIEVHATLVGQRMNEIMKVLTVIATIFIPLSFVTGLFGMNFEHMPELGYRYAYPAVLIAMAAIALGMLVYFRRLGWIGRKS